MPKRVHVNVKNCAMASSTFAVMSWSALTAIDVKASITATANDAAETDFSSLRVITLNHWVL